MTTDFEQLLTQEPLAILLAQSKPFMPMFTLLY